jgi:hypothetical protein
MITLNTNQGLVRIQTWEEIEDTPGYTPVLDAKASPLKSILGNYAFADHHPCGLSHCRTGHGKGYLVQTEQGAITNIGHRCGAKNFSVNFKQLTKNYHRDLRAKEQREELTSLQLQAPALLARIEGLKAGDGGGNWIKQTLAVLKDRNRSLPEPVLGNLNGMVRRQNGAIMVGREATPAEIAQRRAQGLKVGPDPVYVDEEKGHLEGLAALYPLNDLWVLLVQRSGNVIKALEVMDVATLPEKHRREMVRAIQDIEPALADAVEVIGYCRRLLTQANIAQLAVLARSREEERQVLDFAQTLPVAQAASL